MPLKNRSAWNILLMMMALIIAIYLPFELFLFAYAVLGPLHYLTEINWLNEKSFFLVNRKYAWILIGLTVMTSLTIVARVILPYFDKTQWIEPLSAFANSAYGSIVLFCLVLAAGLVYSGKLIPSLLMGASLAVILYFVSSFAWLIGILLPSLVHVYLFMLLFILYGAVKTQNKMALLESIALAIVPLIILFMPIDMDNYSLEENTLATFRQSNFQQLSFVVGKIFRADDARHHEFFLLSEAGIRVQIFISFAYLYHYLNWFSKVSLIGWLKGASFSRVIVIAVLWALSIGLYAYDYKTGLSALFLLSLLHVTLEFPLNIITAKELFSFLRNRL